MARSAKSFLLLLLSAVLIYSTVICLGERTPADSFAGLLGHCIRKNEQLNSELCSLKHDCAGRPPAPRSPETLGDEASPATSCFEIAQRRRNAASGVYYILTGDTVTKLYCHLESLGGCGGQGWTPLMKIDGRKTTFSFNSSLWTNKDVYQISAGQTGFDDKETKLPTYNHLPFTELCLVFRPAADHDQEKRQVLIESASPATLGGLISGDQYSATAVGRAKWLSALPGAALQPNCNKEGFNVRAGLSSWSLRARIGFLGNNEADCITADTHIGVGSGGMGCGSHFYRMSAGNGRFSDAPNCSSSTAIAAAAFVHVLAQ